MPDVSQIAGIVLVGGRSSRMGRDKAFLELKGKPLVGHMLDVLRSAGLKDVFVSGHVQGYRWGNFVASFKAFGGRYSANF